MKIACGLAFKKARPQAIFMPEGYTEMWVHRVLDKHGEFYFYFSDILKGVPL